MTPELFDAMVELDKALARLPRRQAEILIAIMRLWISARRLERTIQKIKQERKRQ